MKESEWYQKKYQCWYVFFFVQAPKRTNFFFLDYRNRRAFKFETYFSTFNGCVCSPDDINKVAFFSSKSEFSLVSNLATCVNCLDLHERKPTYASSKDKGRVKDVLHASLCSKNGRINKETKLNPQLRFWQVLYKSYVSCTLGAAAWSVEQFCSFSFDENVFVQFRSTLLSKICRMEACAFAHMRLPILECFFCVRLNQYISTNKRTKNNLFEVLRKQLSILSCFFFLFQQRILISFEFSNMRELFGFARMQTNLNKFKGQSEGKRRASCVVLF